MAYHDDGGRRNDKQRNARAWDEGRHNQQQPRQCGVEAVEEAGGDPFGQQRELQGCCLLLAGPGYIPNQPGSGPSVAVLDHALESGAREHAVLLHPHKAGRHEQGADDEPRPRA